MTTTVKVLIPAKISENAQTIQYTAPAGVKAIIDKFIATNYSGAPASLSINLVTAAGAAGNLNLFPKTKTLQAGETYTFPEITGAALEPGDFISTLASAATSISIRCNGREIS